MILKNNLATKKSLQQQKHNYNKRLNERERAKRESEKKERKYTNFIVKFKQQHRLLLRYFYT